MTLLSDQSLRELWSTVSTTVKIEQATLAYIRQILQPYEEQLSGVHTAEILALWIQIKFSNDILAMMKNQLDNNLSVLKETVVRCLLTEIMTGALNRAVSLNDQRVTPWDVLEGSPKIWPYHQYNTLPIYIISFGRIRIEHADYYMAMGIVDFITVWASASDVTVRVANVPLKSALYQRLNTGTVDSLSKQPIALRNSPAQIRLTLRLLNCSVFNIEVGSPNYIRGLKYAANLLNMKISDYLHGEPVV